MNGNNPYAGLPGVTGAGQRAPADVPEVTGGQRRALQRDASLLAARTRELLPDEYVVDAEVSTGLGGPQVTVAVHPPIGRPVSAGYTPDREGVADPDAEVITSEDRDEVARGLAASAALQVKWAIGDDVTPTAR